MQNQLLGPDSTPDWNSLAPVLDEAMASLSAQDREAILLRFFKNQDFRALGAALGVSDDTAQKRVSRSLEKLRAALCARGVRTTTIALSAALATNAVQAAPAGLAAAWLAASISSSAAGTISALAFVKIMGMTKFQTLAASVLVTGLALTTVYEFRSARSVQEENQALRQQLANSSALSTPAPQPTNAITTVSFVGQEQFRELVRLRGEVAMLRQQTNTLARMQLENQQLHERAKALEDIFRFEAMEARTGNAGKQIAMAFYDWSKTNANTAPGNFVFVSDTLAKNLTMSLDAFEMINADIPRVKGQETLLARERLARRVPRIVPIAGLRDAEDTEDEGWERTYIFSNGSEEQVRLLNGNFDAWENTNQVRIPIRRWRP
jgi:hypothetical protein